MKVRLAVFGVGMHFQETYSMAFRRREIKNLCAIEWAADLASRRTLALKRCKDAGQKPEFVGVENFTGTSLPAAVAARLDAMFAEHPVDAVLVSTTPEQHRAYAEWAIKKGLAVLIDKPVTTRERAMRDTEQAAGILKDWQALHALAGRHKAFVLVNSHRRFHPAYTKVSELLGEAAQQTGTGVTAISSFNSDGQWRLPQELLDITYHGYNTGNGVLSHFGYHYLDLAMLWYKKGTPRGRLADRMAVSSSLSSAYNYSHQLSTADAARALVKVGQPGPEDNDTAVRRAIKDFGEVDAFCSAELYRGDTLAAHISVQLLHSGFSQRAWTKPAQNLYKENGRVRWENHLLQQGPFQSIEIRSFQAVQPNWKEPDENIPRWELGGADHLEINVYRNGILGKPVLETINCRDLLKKAPEHDVVHEDTKANVLLYFSSAVALRNGPEAARSIPKETEKKVKQLMAGDSYDLSLLGTHQATAAFMSACYEAYASSNKVEEELVW